MNEELRFRYPTGNLHDAFQDEQIHDIWESAYRNNRFQDRCNDIIMDRIVRRLDLPPGASVLDAGCGIGDHTIRLAAHGFCCTGVDVSCPILARARRLAAAKGLASQISYACCGLEDLSRLDRRFDAVHCRGVLMHIPDWRHALRELCRVLLPGGRIVIVENNHRSLEMAIVRVIRKLRRSEARVRATPAGIEFHRTRDGQAPLSRVANIPYLMVELKKHEVHPTCRFATEFWDISRFSAGMARNCAIMFNRAWFMLRLPALLSSGNAVIGRKEVV